MPPPVSETIRIAFLGADDTTVELARAVDASRRFELVGVCEVESASGERGTQALRGIAAHTRPLPEWEALLDQALVDAVIVARGADEDRRADQLRKLIQAGVPLLVSHPVVESMLVYYELDMIRRDTSCVVVPYLPWRSHPAIKRLAEMVRETGSSPIGSIQQVIVQRRISDPTKEQVFSWFARDVDAIRKIAGDMTRLGAMAGSHEQPAYGSLGVQMSGPSGIATRWSVDPIQTAAGAHISLLGDNGKVVVVAAAQGPWTLEVAVGGKVQLETFENWDPAATALHDLALAMDGETLELDWVDAARNVELAETIARSLHKGRTIELYYEDYTEQGTFKGTMTSLGCGLLLMGMILLGVVAIAEQIGVPYVRGWPYFLLALFGVFLLLQLLMLVFRKPQQ